MQPISPKMPPEVCMLECHYVPRPKTSNHRGTGGRCIRKFACLSFIFLISQGLHQVLASVGGWGLRSLLGHPRAHRLHPPCPPCGWNPLASRFRFRQHFDRRKSTESGLQAHISKLLGASSGSLATSASCFSVVGRFGLFKTMRIRHPSF